jgi:predicted nucleic-acid-binding Zn-ribbon protein
MVTVKSCPNCRNPMKFSYAVDLKTGGIADIADSELLVGLPKLPQGILTLNLHVCQKCGAVQFFASEEIKKSLLNIADQRSSQ